MLNKQGPGKIDWTDWTWNPIKGCLHGCQYCYMNRMEKRFPGIMKPGFKSEYLGDFDRTRKVKHGDKIFVGSSGDVWGRWVPDTWTIPVMTVVQDFPQFTFQFLTKNPAKYAEFYLPRNGWYGTTVDGTKKTDGNISKLVEAVQSCHVIRFVSFEPLLDHISPDLFGINWIIIGANSNKGAGKAPDKWADELIRQARDLNIPVWVKDNYKYHTRIKEFPANQAIAADKKKRCG